MSWPKPNAADREIGPLPATAMKRIRRAQAADMSHPIMDKDDQEVFTAGFMLSEAARRFLARNMTQRIIRAGLLDEDVVADLERCSKRMYDARIARIENARAQDRAEGRTG